MHPKLKFEIDYKKDVRTFFNFASDWEYENGRILEWAIFAKYPLFKKFKKNKKLEVQKSFVKKFVSGKYKKNIKIFRKNLKIYDNNWKKIEKNFYKLTEEIFGKTPWPKGKYIVYLTIWGMFPRFLEDKTFQIPAKYKRKKYVSVVIAHEMLHFIFYDYFLAKYPKYKGKKNYFFVWHVSEIFNSVVQDSPEWIKLFKINCMPYPEHNKIVRILRKKYYRVEKWDVDLLIKDIIILVNQNSSKLGGIAQAARLKK